MSHSDNGSSFTPALTPDVPDSTLSKNQERVQASICLGCLSVQFADLVCCIDLQILTDG